ncbi:hypothetical protein P2318_33795 [Myxococcaceae bacterium GXIMD 01537]
MSAEALSDAEFLAAVEAATHPGEQFGHVAHVRLAWLCLKAHGFEAGLARVRQLIREYATALGAPGKFHETLTRGWALLVWGAMRASPGARTFHALLEAHPELKDARLLLRHYSEPRLQSPEAKSGWVEPDVAPLPGAG